MNAGEWTGHETPGAAPVVVPGVRTADREGFPLLADGGDENVPGLRSRLRTRAFGLGDDVSSHWTRGFVTGAGVSGTLISASEMAARQGDWGPALGGSLILTFVGAVVMRWL